MKVCPFDDKRECPLAQRERSDNACVACQLAEVSRGLKEWHEERGQKCNIVWVWPVNMPSIADLADADKRMELRVRADRLLTDAEIEQIKKMREAIR